MSPLTTKLGFDAYSRKITSLAKAKKVGHMVPASNALYRLWELQVPPEQVVKNHCVKEVQRERTDQ